MRKIISSCLLVVLFAAANMAHAESAKDTPKSAKDIPVADFFKNPAYGGMQLSPNGKYMATLVDVLDRRNLMVMETNNLSKVEMLTGFKKQNVGGFFWTDNERIVFTMDSSNGREAVSLYTVKRGEKRPKIVKLLGADFGDRGVITAQVVHELPNESNHLIVSYNRRYIKAPDLYKLSLDSKWNPRKNRKKTGKK